VVLEVDPLNQLVADVFNGLEIPPVAVELGERSRSDRRDERETNPMNDSGLFAVECGHVKSPPPMRSMRRR
jgi:hypothetical protein